MPSDSEFPVLCGQQYFPVLDSISSLSSDLTNVDCNNKPWRNSVSRGGLPRMDICSGANVIPLDGEQCMSDRSVASASWGGVQSMEGWSGATVVRGGVEKQHNSPFIFEPGFVVFTSFLGGWQSSGNSTTSCMFWRISSVSCCMTPIFLIRNKWSTCGKKIEIILRLQVQNHKSNSFVHKLSRLEPLDILTLIML